MVNTTISDIFYTYKSENPTVLWYTVDFSGAVVDFKDFKLSDLKLEDCEEHVRYWHYSVATNTLFIDIYER